jgi:phosphate transport system substrate-binding protein
MGINSTDETPTSGNIKIGVDESFQLLLDTEIYTFEALYKYGHIKPFYKPENDILSYFMNDSVRLIVTTRKLTKDEESYLNNNYRIFPRTTKIAYDAIAFIVNKNNPDTLIRYNTIKKIFSGEVDNWKKINPKSRYYELKVVFDNNQSGNVRYFKEKFDIKKEFPSYCYSANNNEGVINYVENHANTLGIISVNWISDKHDSLTRKFLKRVNVVAISSEFDSEGEDFYRPYQGYIADKSYPFIREVYIISRETFSGLGSGFTAFVAGDQGQRIILKSGLVPATMPIRLIQLK